MTVWVIIAAMCFVLGFSLAALLNMAKDEEHPPAPQNDAEELLGPEGPVYPRIDKKA